MKYKPLRAIDICAGAGGWGIAARGLPIEIVEAVDMAEDCLETYRYNHAETKTTCMDATELNWKRFRGVDLVLGGIPCEEVSPARRGLFRKPTPGAIEKWHKLIDSVLAGIRLANPKFWRLENVIQMRRHLPPLTDGRRRVMQFTEAAALQGFPDDYVFVATPDRAWKMVAQAIPIPVGRAILEAVCLEAAGLDQETGSEKAEGASA